MPLNVTVAEPTDRPTIPRASSDELDALVEEVLPLVRDVIKLDSDKALPVTVPTDEKEDLVRALRAAGEREKVTIRFKRFARFNAETGEQEMTAPREGSDAKPKPIFDPWEFTNKRRTTVRVTFWSTKKIERKPRNQGNSESTKQTENIAAENTEQTENAAETVS